MARKTHKANVHGAAVGNGGLADQMAARKRRDGTKAGGDAKASTSIFDPTLCELLLRWYSPPEGIVLDPFAGGSVRGIVSAMLGRHYIGIELRPEQVAANWDQGETILTGEAMGLAAWATGDSEKLLSTMPLAKLIELSGTSDDWPEVKRADFVLTCPPYADLEVYSQMPDDISNMSYSQFRRSLRNILAYSFGWLADDRFMAVVIGDARSKTTGELYGLPAHVISDMQASGAKLWNRLILATPAGSAPMRAKAGFTTSRKNCPVHQDVLVFLKGDARRAAKAIGPCEFGQLDTSRFEEVEGASAALADALAAQMEK